MDADVADSDYSYPHPLAQYDRDRRGSSSSHIYDDVSNAGTGTIPTSEAEQPPASEQNYLLPLPTTTTEEQQPLILASILSVEAGNTEKFPPDKERAATNSRNSFLNYKADTEYDDGCSENEADYGGHNLKQVAGENSQSQVLQKQYSCYPTTPSLCNNHSYNSQMITTGTEINISQPNTNYENFDNSIGSATKVNNNTLADAKLHFKQTDDKDKMNTKVHDVEDNETIQDPADAEYCGLFGRLYPTNLATNHLTNQEERATRECNINNPNQLTHATAPSLVSSMKQAVRTAFTQMSSHIERALCKEGTPGDYSSEENTTPDHSEGLFGFL